MVMAQRSFYDDEDDDNEFDGPSRTQIKNEMTALQELGVQLIGLQRKQLATLGLPDRLFDALIEAKRLTAHGAVRRQMQFIGKLMRHTDTAPIHALLDKINGVSDVHNGWLHQLENWREQLIGDPAAFDQLVADYPDADVQHLRTLIRNAQKELAAQKSPKSARALFQALKTLRPEPTRPQVAQDTEEEDALDDE